MFPQTILNGFILEHICWFYFNQWESVSVHTTQSFVMHVHGLQFTMEPFQLECGQNNNTFAALVKVNILLFWPHIIHGQTPCLSGYSVFPLFSCYD